MIEKTFTTDREYWPEDDQWSGHYLLVTGYDDAAEMFTVMTPKLAPTSSMSYAELDEKWQSFNHVYIMVYPPEMEDGHLNRAWAKIGMKTSIARTRLRMLMRQPRQTRRTRSPGSILAQT